MPQNTIEDSCKKKFIKMFVIAVRMSKFVLRAHPESSKWAISVQVSIPFVVV